MPFDIEKEKIAEIEAIADMDTENIQCQHYGEKRKCNFELISEHRGDDAKLNKMLVINVLNVKKIWLIIIVLFATYFLMIVKQVLSIAINAVYVV